MLQVNPGNPKPLKTLVRNASPPSCITSRLLMPFSRLEPQHIAKNCFERACTLANSAGGTLSPLSSQPSCNFLYASFILPCFSERMCLATEQKENVKGVQLTGGTLGRTNPKRMIKQHLLTKTRTEIVTKLLSGNYCELIFDKVGDRFLI
jgi:hypothetical protein